MLYIRITSFQRGMCLYGKIYFLHLHSIQHDKHEETFLFLFFFLIKSHIGKDHAEKF